LPYAPHTETYTFLFTDIEESTALLKRVGGETYADVLADHHSVIRSALLNHGGREIGTQGDGFFAVFSSPSASVAAVIEMQRALGFHAWPADEQVRVRMGIHSGEASEESTGLVGFEVHRAARIAAVAHGGQIVLSATSADLVRDALPQDASLLDLGQHRLKDLGHPEQIFQLQADGLEVHFPPLRSLDNPALANNLPAQLASFVGRTAEVAEVRLLSEEHRLVTLAGAGGSGKTRLGLHVAADLLDGSGDGVWLVELAAVADPAAVVMAIAAVLGITNQSGQPPLETLLDALAPQHMLVVLDNCEHVIGECAKVADAILRRCPHVNLLATSREPLGISGETIYRVPSLSLPADGDAASLAGSDAVALFLDRARAQAVELILDEETSPLVASICRRLDGMPLAIELAAARLRSLSLASLHDRLDQRFRLLTGGSRTALERQQTLRATVDWSYSLLSAPEQSVLRRLSVFVDGFDLEAAEGVCGLGDIEAFEITDLLGSLVDKSLVVAETSGGSLRYRLLETIRQFGAERLLESGEAEAAAIRAAHSAYFLSVAEATAPYLYGPDQGRWLTRLATDQANLRRAIEHAIGNEDETALVLRFAVALGRYWSVRSPSDEVVGLLLPVLERPEAKADLELLGAGLVAIGSFVVRVRSIHENETARHLAEYALEITRQLDDDRLHAQALALLCEAWYFAGDAHRAGLLAKEAFERASVVGDDKVLGRVLSAFNLNSQFVDPARSEELFNQALACNERTGDRYETAHVQLSAGVNALRAGNIPAARSHMEQALDLFQGLGLTAPSPQVFFSWLLREEGNGEGAVSAFEEVLRVSRRTGYRNGTARANLGLACLASDHHDWERSAVLHGAAQAFVDQSGYPWLDPEVRYRETSLGEVRSRLSEEEFQRAYTHGRGLSFDEAFALALAGGRTG
jgi:predicted ATPase/class 3 adenylate cyclase